MAFVVLNELGTRIDSRGMQLPSYSNNFEAEGVAIMKALEYVPNLKEAKHVQILTDSLSTLRALANSENRNVLVNQIKAKYRIIKETVNVQFSFVKAHSGIIGNELADELAKEAITTGSRLELPITKQFINKQLAKNVLEKWNHLWNSESKDSALYQWIRNVKHIPEHFPTDHLSSQALTGHGRFPFYFYRFGIRDNNQCQCGKVAEDIDHYLKDCSLTQDLRIDLMKRHNGRCIEAKPEIVKNEGSLEIIRKMIDIINTSAT